MNIKEILSEEMLGRNSYSAPLVLTLFSLALFLPGLGARDLWAPGEPIYGEIIRVMYERSNWLVPMLNGQLYADKPVLYFWLALIFSKIGGGVNEWTVRLPAALGGLGLVLMTFEFGRTFYDRETGLFSGLILATTYRVLWESRFLRLDTVLSFFLFIGFYFFLKAFTKRGPKNNYLLAYLCFALATLTKGPIGLVLPGLAILALILLTGRWKEIKEMHLLSGTVVVLAVIIPWLLLLHLRGDDQWLREFLWVHNIQNYALKPIGHIRPFYYYFINLPPDFLPWTLLLPGALIFYYPWKEKLRDPATLALCCWFVAIFVFFSVSKSKINYYLLPVLPALALFVGCYTKALIVDKEAEGTHWRWTAGSLYLFVCLFVLAGVALPVAVYKLERGLFVWSLVTAAVLVAGSISVFVSLRGKQLPSIYLSLLALLLGVYVIASAGVFPYLDKYKSPRPIGEVIRSRLSQNSPLYIFQSTMADFNYYARREQIPVVESEDQLNKVTLSGRGAYLIINDKDLREAKFSVKSEIVTVHQVGEKKWYLLRLS
jgi:4-amino-4-deoxy-L-arabinose transferase-like glycosyltransferase